MIPIALQLTRTLGHLIGRMDHDGIWNPGWQTLAAVKEAFVEEVVSSWPATEHHRRGLENRHSSPALPEAGSDGGVVVGFLALFPGDAWPSHRVLTRQGESTCSSPSFQGTNPIREDPPS